MIGKNAGIIWNLLNNGERWEHEALKAASGLSDRDLDTATAGWQEKDKIFFEIGHDKPQGISVSLFGFLFLI